MKKIAKANSFNADYRKWQRSGNLPGNFHSVFKEVLELLSSEKVLPPKYQDHKLKGKYKGYRDCHIFPDLVLLYKSTESNIKLYRLEIHSNLFK